MPYDWSRNTSCRAHLQASVADLEKRTPASMVAVVSHSEVNNRHGTGIVIQRLFPDDSRVLSIRAVSDWGGEQEFGALQLVIPWQADRAHIYRWVLEETRDFDVGRIVCIPFTRFEVIAAVALADAYTVPFCLYVMDDQNITVPMIPDELMAEAIGKASVRLAISSDMRDAYMAKFGHRFWIAPPTIAPEITPTSSGSRLPKTGVIVGNVWGRSWFDALRETVRESGLRVDWFSNAAESTFWLDLDPAALRKDGIRLFPPIPEHELAQRLGSYEFAIVPTAPHDADENRGVASLSLPSRIPFLIGACDLPIMVLGDPQTYVARFVEHYRIGKACSYNSGALVEAVLMTRDITWRTRQAQPLDRLRATLTGSDLDSWLTATILDSRPPSDRFETLTVSPTAYIPGYIGDSQSAGFWLGNFDETLAAFRRLAEAGFSPTYVIDVGASTGVWSEIVGRVFPSSWFLLVEPLFSRHDQAAAEAALSALPRATVREVAVAAQPGRATIHVDHLLFGSSLLESFTDEATEPIEIEVTTLDLLAAEYSLDGDGVLKLDIQGGELDALRGAVELLPSIAVLVIDVTLDTSSQAPSFDDVHAFLIESGFVWYDDVGSWRDPSTGTLLQEDLMYVRRDSRLAERRRQM